MGTYYSGVPKWDPNFWNYPAWEIDTESPILRTRLVGQNMVGASAPSVGIEERFLSMISLRVSGAPSPGMYITQSIHWVLECGV